MHGYPLFAHRPAYALLCSLALLALACDSREPPPPDLSTPQGILAQARISMQEVTSYRMEGQVRSSIAEGENRVEIAVEWSAPNNMRFVSHRTAGADDEIRELVLVDGLLYAKDPETGGAWQRQPDQPGWSFAPWQFVPRLCRPRLLDASEGKPDEIVIAGNAALREQRGPEELCEAAGGVHYTVRIRAGDHLLVGYELTIDGSEANHQGLRPGETETALYTFSRHNEPITIEPPAPDE